MVLISAKVTMFSGYVVFYIIAWIVLSLMCILCVLSSFMVYARHFFAIMNNI